MPLKTYPDMKIGFTAQNFMKALPLSLESLKKLVDFARQEGFVFMEIRDPYASLGIAECKTLAAYAKSRNIETVYAVNIGFLDPDFRRVFYKGLMNASVFTHGPRTMRDLVAGPEYADPGRITPWTADEFGKIIEIAAEVSPYAKELGIKLSIENAFEVLHGDVSGFGTAEFFQNAKDVYWEFDTSNFFAVSRTPADPKDVKAFLVRNASRITYIHLKTASPDHRVTDIISENELPLVEIFDELKKNKIRYIALELPQQATFEECALNHVKSMEYLKGRF